MKKVLLLFQQPLHHWKYWISLSLLIKGLMFVFFISENPREFAEGVWGHVSSDTFSYLEPIDNFLSHGSYEPDLRKPGYGIFYLIFRLFFVKSVACNLLIVLQYIIASLSVYYLALSAWSITKQSVIFYLTFYFYLLSTYTSFYDVNLLTESLTTSLLIFSLYFFTRFIYEKNCTCRLSFSTLSITNLLISGILLAWAFFMRPVFAPIVVVYSIVLIMHFIVLHIPMQKWVTLIFVFCLPYLFSETIDIIRNYTVYHKLRILHGTYYQAITDRSPENRIGRFVGSWGGNNTPWNPVAEIRWFGIKENRTFKKEPLPDKYREFPKYIYTSQYNLDSLKILKQMFLNYCDKNLNKEEKLNYATLIINKMEKYTESIRKEKPFLFFIIAPLKHYKTWLIHSGTYYLFNKPVNRLNKVELTVKIFYSLIYLFIIAFGHLGMFIAFVISWKNKNAMLALIPFLLLVALIVHLIIISFVTLIEWRYFVSIYPFMLVCASAAIFYFYIFFLKLIPKKR